MAPPSTKSPRWNGKSSCIFFFIHHLWIPFKTFKLPSPDHQTLLCYLRASRSLIASNYSPKGSLLYMLHTTLRMVFVKWSLLVIPSCSQDNFQSPWLQSSRKAGLYLKLQPYLNIINHLQFCCLQATRLFHTLLPLLGLSIPNDHLSKCSSLSRISTNYSSLTSFIKLSLMHPKLFTALSIIKLSISFCNFF